MSDASFYSTGMRWGATGGPGVLLHDSLARGRVTAGGRHHPVPGGMLETAENVAEQYGITRAEQDGYAVRSHHRAAAATEAGRFADEIVPVTVPGRKGDTVVDRDEHHPPGHVGRGAGPAPPGAGRHGHGRERGRPERRRRRLRGHHRRAGRRAGPCDRWPGWSTGPWPGCRRPRWASARCRPWPSCSPRPVWPWPRWT